MWVEIRGYVILFGIMSALMAGVSTGTYWAGRLTGSEKCDVRHENAQNTQDKKEKNSDAKRDHAKPVDVDRAGLLDWLRNYTSQK